MAKNFNIDSSALNFERRASSRERAAASQSAGKMMKSTFSIPEDLYYRFRYVALKSHMKLGEAMTLAVSEFVRSREEAER